MHAAVAEARGGDGMAGAHRHSQQTLPTDLEDFHSHAYTEPHSPLIPTFIVCVIAKAPQAPSA